MRGWVVHSPSSLPLFFLPSNLSCIFMFSKVRRTLVMEQGVRRKVAPECWLIISPLGTNEIDPNSAALGSSSPDQMGRGNNSLKQGYSLSPLRQLSAANSFRESRQEATHSPE